MSQIEYEDRTAESPEMAINRQVEAASDAIVRTAIMVSRGSPVVGLGALTLALGQVAARTGVPVEEVIEAIKQAYDYTAAALAQTARISDA